MAKNMIPLFTSKKDAKEFLRKYRVSVLYFNTPRLSNYVVSKRTLFVYEVIDKDGNIMFLIERKYYFGSGEKSKFRKRTIFRWYGKDKKSNSWYDRLWMCVLNGVDSVDGPMIEKSVIDHTISNYIPERTDDMDFTVKKVSALSGFSKYVVAKYMAEHLTDVE